MSVTLGACVREVAAVVYRGPEAPGWIDRNHCSERSRKSSAGTGIAYKSIENDSPFVAFAIIFRNIF